MTPSLFLLLLLLLPHPLAGAAFSEYYCNDTAGNSAANSAFQANLRLLAAALPANASASPVLFATAAVGAAPDTVSALALCRGDTADGRACLACLTGAFREAQRLCPYGKDATYYHDLCHLRYSGAGEFLASPEDNSPVINAMDANGSTYAGWDARNATSRAFFGSLVGTLLGEMAMYGAYNSTRRYASAAMFINSELPTVYGDAQCTPDMGPAQCWQCFQGLTAQTRDWYDGREGGRILGVRCNFRYEGYRFYAGEPLVKIGFPASPASGGAHGEKGNKHKKVLIIVVVVAIAVLCSFLLLCFIWIKRQSKKGEMKLQEQSHSRNSSKTEEALRLWKIEESSSDFTLYDFSDIAAATDNFSEENKLGKGGFGPVYKGRLPDGLEIAVKRLAAHSGQGLIEFKNEIQLIAKLQHTNLVRLLGCCIQEEEKILVYEYMPNKSLDFFIFGQQRGAILDWKKRFRIIEGIAHGLLYLHKHSRLRIIHRDLKASNILLDEDLNPKISDFGMARIFGSNMTEANTDRVVGTYGYMAPEYASEGIFSVKSDVFSFGVLLLEIISGKKNSGYHIYGDFYNLLGYAWQMSREARGFELIDPTLGDCTDATVVIMRCIKVALLCVQENATDRPTMSDVVAMLGSDGVSLPEPRPPPYFHVRIADGGDDGSEVRTHDPSGSCSTNDVTITDVEGR